MTSHPGRRVVRATPEFFDELDSQLPADRSEHTPSRSDFQAYDLLPIIDRFATGWDDLPDMYPGMSHYRVVVVTGRVVPAVSVLGRLRADGSIELIGIDIDLTPQWGDDQDDED